MYGMQTTDAAVWQRQGWVVRSYNVPLVLAEPPAMEIELRDHEWAPFEPGEIPLVEPEQDPHEEDWADLEAARRALAESAERIPYDRVRRELGLA